MFFIRFGRKHPSLCRNPNDHAPERRDGRRRAIVLSLTVAMVLNDVGLMSVALAQPAPEQPSAAQLSPSEQLSQGLGEYEAGQYEDAQATLQQVDAEALSEDERQRLTEALARAESAAAERRAARAELQLGNEALTADRPGEALEHYRQAAENMFADDATRQQALEQIEVAQGVVSEQPGETQDPRSLYLLARKQYRDGDWQAARANFQAAQAAGYKPRLFEDAPAKYLSRMDRKEQADAEKARQQAEGAAQDALAETAMQAPAEPAPLEVVQATEPAQDAQPQPAQDTQPQPAQDALPEPVEAAPMTQPQDGAEPEIIVVPPEEAEPVVPEQPAAPSEPLAPAQPGPGAGLQETATAEQIRQQQRAFEAEGLVEQARQAQAEGRYDVALELFSRALELNPENEQAVAGRAEMQVMAGRAPQEGGLLQRQEQLVRARREAIRYSFNQAIEEARQATENNNFAAAANALEAARVARAAAVEVFRPEELREFDAIIVSTQTALDRRTEVVRAEEARRAAAGAIEAATERERRIRIEQERTVAQLIRQARQLIEQRQFREALGVIDQILQIDPTNDYAVGVRMLVEDKALIMEQREYTELFDRYASHAVVEAQERRIPYTEIVKYPTNWPDIVSMREQGLQQEQGISDQDQAVLDILERRFPEIRFDAVAFSDVVDFLRDMTGVNVYVNWRALEAAGIDRSTPVTARLRDVRFSKALDTILADVGGGVVELDYTVDEGVLMISTEEDLSANVLTRVYDIRDLLVNVAAAGGGAGGAGGRAGGGARAGGGGGGLGGGGGGFGGGGGGFGGGGGGLGGGLGGGGARAGGAGGGGAIGGGDPFELIDLITEIVAPDTWRETGGTVGSIRPLSGQLIVTQTPENHQSLQNLLAQLREQRAILITVETRFLTIQRNYLEDVGLDVDFLFNVDGLEDDQGLGPVLVRQGTTSTDPDSGVATGYVGGVNQPIPGSLSPAGIQPSLLVSSTYLDDFVVDFVLRATQAAQWASLVTAPRVTVFNGQQATIAVNVERPYVGDLDPVVANGAVAYDPQVETLAIGVTLTVQATVSADRKYVTLTVATNLTDLIQIATFSFSTILEAGDDDDDDDDDVIVADLVIQEPETRVVEVTTTVSVPDGGTLLLGGQTLAGETEREQGVPVLSKIPFLKRLFTNRSMIKDEQILFILVKPTIIIQAEQEQQQFPLLSTRLGQ